ncbi:hypothetical protein AB0C29_12295 [Actinoplanes sp. NPDC048791]|uniref:hypothetical protein n=1 Tax=Actinoplanes sp. NPDC048791 TaxID=3154623 RepID=UPI0033E10F10
MTQTAERRPAANGTATNLADETTQQRNPEQPALPTVRALLFPATGRRTLDTAVVTRCPWCCRTHLHRGADLNGAVRESGCRPARDYVLAVRR